MSNLGLLISVIFVSCVSISKEGIKQVDVLETNYGEMLNVQEVELLDSLLESSRGTFSFEGKKVAFITGSSGSKIIPKTDFFKTCINPWIESNMKPQAFMALLTTKEKEESGGYDAFVLSWVKVFTDRRKRKTIEQLGNN